MSRLYDYSGSSFVKLLECHHPELLPATRGLTITAEIRKAAEGTTIVAVRYQGGVVIAGDRRATVNGHYIMNEYVTKVFRIDDYSAMAIAGVFGPSVKMAKLFQTEIEHYEKIEGVELTLEGKSNRLAGLVEANLPAAMQGMPVMPLFAGYDVKEGCGKTFEYDITGGTFVLSEHEPFSTSGSGGERARTTFEHFYRDDMTAEDTIELVKKALVFAAKKDAATGGERSVIMDISAKGIRQVGPEE